MKFRFTGDPRNDGDGPTKITAFGHAFEKGGKPVNVDDEKVVAKLLHNDHFTEVVPRAAKATGDNETAE